MGTIRREENVRTHCPLYPPRPFRAEEASFEPDAEPVHPDKNGLGGLAERATTTTKATSRSPTLSTPRIDRSLAGRFTRMSVASGSGHGSVSPAPSYDLSIAGL